MPLNVKGALRLIYHIGELVHFIIMCLLSNIYAFLDWSLYRYPLRKLNLCMFDNTGFWGLSGIYKLIVEVGYL